VLGDGIASATWVANWRFIVNGTSYADLFALPSPFQHFWSLAVEEQFYVLLPLLVVLLLGRRADRPRTRLLAATLLALVVASTVQLALLFGSHEVTSRAYYGTDSRAAELLVGALLAMLLSRAGARALRRRASWALQAAGLAALAGLGTACVLLPQTEALLYHGGLLAVAVLTATVIAAAMQPGGLVGRALAVRPLAELGIISYGVYLYHWPVFLLLDHRFTGLPPVLLLALRLATTLGLAWLSYWMVEHPVRYGPMPARQALPTWALGATAGVVAVGLASGQIPMPAFLTPHPPQPVMAGGPLAPQPGRALTPLPQRVSGLSAVPPRRAASTAAPAVGTGPSQVPVPTSRQPASVPVDFAQNPHDAPVPPQPDVPPGALKVAVVGDSVAGNLGQGLKILASERGDLAVYNLALPGCPITRGRLRRLGPDLPFDVDPVCAWWADPGSERRQALETFHPDVIVTEDGINEVLDRKLDAWGQWRSPQDTRFDTWVVDEFRAATALWTSQGAKVLVVNAPCGDWHRYDAYRELTNPELRVADLNVSAYGQMAGVSHADLFQRVCPTGRYQDNVEGYPHGRPDGFHFTPEASTALARNWLGPLVFDTGRTPLAP
jgi:peptidoglycan/LPS O-acetylase OafA/YrhL